MRDLRSPLIVVVVVVVVVVVAIVFAAFSVEGEASRKKRKILREFRALGVV